MGWSTLIDLTEESYAWELSILSRKFQFFN